MRYTFTKSFLVKFLLLLMLVSASNSYAFGHFYCTENHHQGKKVTTYERTTPSWLFDKSERYKCRRTVRMTPINKHYILVGNILNYYSSDYRLEERCRIYSLACHLGRSGGSSYTDYYMTLDYYPLEDESHIDQQHFTALSDKYPVATDGVSLYLKDKKLKGAIIPNTLALAKSMQVTKPSISAPYLVVGSNVIYNGVIIQGADAASFVILDDYPHYYSKDKHAVYYKGTALPNADPSTFELIFTIYSDGIAKDKKQVYWRAELIQYADAQTFRIENHLAQDKQHVWKLYEKKAPELAPQFDPNIEYIGHDYSRSRTQVFYKGTLLAKAEPNTFSIVKFSCGSPNNTCNDTPKEMCSITKNLSCLYLQQYYLSYNRNWAKDKNHFYLNGQTLDFVDVDSFQWLYSATEIVLARDKNTLFIPLQGGGRQVIKPPLVGPFFSRYTSFITTLFADQQGFYLFDSIGMAKLCADELSKTTSIERGVLRQITPPNSSVHFAFEDDFYQYFFKNANNAYPESAYKLKQDVMIDKKTQIRYPILWGNSDSCDPLSN